VKWQVRDLIEISKVIFVIALVFIIGSIIGGAILYFLFETLPKLIMRHL